MKRLFALPPHGGLIGTLAICVFAFFIAQSPSVNASQKKEARVTQVIQDVQLLASNATSRPAAVNDNIQAGTAVRTGQGSRTELTFSDQTLTRLGANSVFSFDIGGGTFDLGHGSILMQVPPNGSSVKVKTAAVTAAITGGTALFGTGPPTKFMVLEGTGTFYPAGHPEEAVTLHGGEMVTLTPDGHIVGPTGFNVKTVLETSELIVDFPDLANLPLILAVIREQDALYSAIPTPTPKDSTDTVDQKTAASESQESTGPADKFGAPSTIGSPNPYVINSSTQIQTDPSITTNGVTDSGKIYRGQGTDGLFTAYAFGSTSSFDTASGFDNTISDSGALFKFTSLQLTGNPTVSTTDGETSLGLIGVNGVTSGGPGGTLTFAGIDGLLIATQNGSINLGPEISFAGLHDLNLYARGSGSSLTLGSAVSTSSRVNLFSEGNIQVNGNVSTTNYTAFSGGDYLGGTGVITATGISVTSLGNANIDGEKFPDLPDGGGSIFLNATGTLSIAVNGGTNTRDSFNIHGATINLTSDTPVVLTLSATNPTFTAGSGGIVAPNVGLVGANLQISTTDGGNIHLYSVGVANSTLTGFVHAAGSFTAEQDVTTENLTAGTSIFIGGNTIVGDMTAGTTITVNGRLGAFGTVSAGGNITAGTVAATNINAPNGILTAGDGGIVPFIVSLGGASVQQTYTVDSIVSPNGIDFSGNQYNGIQAVEDGPELSSGGLLTINARAIDFNPTTGIAFANFNGADAGSFESGGPSSGGDGGTFIVNTTGNITTVAGADITATTGLNASEDLGYSGNGGNVTLHSTDGTVTVDGLIQVSSNDFDPEGSEPIRRSASGGNITLTSNLTTGLGISIGGNAQLLSLLGDDATGPGGTILIMTSGADIHMGEFSGAILEADHGTIDIHQTGPGSDGTSLIEIYNTALSAETISIASTGDLELGLEGSIIIDGVTLSLTAANNLTMEGDTFDATATNSSGNVTISAGNTLTVNDDLTISRSGNGRTSGLDLKIMAGTDLSVAGSLLLSTDTFGLESGGNISVTAGGSITTDGDLSAYAIDEGVARPGPVVNGEDEGLGVVTIHADGIISVGGSLNVLGDVSAGGAITASTISSTNVSSDVSINALSGGIIPFSAPGFFSSDVLHTLTAPVVTSTGGINFDGANANGDSSVAFNGGNLMINPDSLSFGTPVGMVVAGPSGFPAGDIMGTVSFNGGDSSSTFGPGNGGTFTVHTTGAITVNSDIEATSGRIQPFSASAGEGGSINLNSDSDTVSVNSRIEVSSAEPTSTMAPYRQSAKGGNIGLTSGKTSGVAINVGSSSQLLSLLNAAPVGAGGKVTIVASAANNTGNSSSINIDNSNGQIRVDGGTIDIQHHGDGGTIAINNANMRADVIKVGAFGTNGTLNIGGGAITADSMLKLYAPGSNGHLNFIATVTLSSGVSAILAANTITIQPTATVHIAGTGGPATIYTNHPDYNFTPGLGYTGPAGNPLNGSFDGNGAHDPQPLSSPIPPF